MPRVVLLAYFLPVAISLSAAGTVLLVVYRAFHRGLHNTANVRARVLAQSRMYTLLYGSYWVVVLVLYLVHSQVVGRTGRRRPQLVHAYALVRCLNGPVALAAWTLTRPESFRVVSQWLRPRQAQHYALKVRVGRGERDDSALTSSAHSRRQA